jgi:hypothetical protein
MGIDPTGEPGAVVRHLSGLLARDEMNQSLAKADIETATVA